MISIDRFASTAPPPELERRKGCRSAAGVFCCKAPTADPYCGIPLKHTNGGQS